VRLRLPWKLPRGQARVLVPAGVAALAAAVVLPLVLSGSSASQTGPVIILAKVEARTLQDTVQLTGTLARKSLRHVTAAGQGLVTSLYATDGSITQVGQSMFALNGRDAIAEPGATPFFRPLAPGDTGDDVLELKRILAAAGDYPGSLTDNRFTEQTQFALAQWQAQHHYPNTAPANNETVNVALQQGPGYQVGAKSSAGLTIGPPPSATPAAWYGGARSTPAVLASYAHAVGPSVTIQSVSDQVAQGQTAEFVVGISSAPASPVTVNLVYSGTADSSASIVTPPSSVTIPTGATSAAIAVQTRATTTVGPSTTLVVTVSTGTGYAVGSPASAQTVIADHNVPQLQISGGTTVTPGGTATLTVTADQAPAVDTQVLVSVGGSAQPGTDYAPVNPVLTLPAGATSATIVFHTVAASVIGSDKFLVVSLQPSPMAYSIGPSEAAVVTIGEDHGPPVVTLTSATATLTRGQPYQIMVSLNEPVTTPLTVALAYGGTAVAGTDYVPPSAPVVVPPGQTVLPITIPTAVNTSVEPDRTLTVSLAPEAGYQIGSPGSATVVVKSGALPTLTLSADKSSIAEGGAASFTITADQAPTQDTSVNFVVQGTALPGQDYEPIPGVALLRAGQTQVTVTLQSIQKNVTFEPTDMITGDWPIRVGTVFVKSGDPVTTGQPILDLTEPTVSVTLAASPSDRTNLQVGQHCTVQISGSHTKVSGTITELDATPTLQSGSSGGGAPGSSTGGGSGGAEMYEGRIDSADLVDLHGADGSTVSISVVDREVNDAPTVPIAAVKQNGQGVDVVRVLGTSGAVSEEPVTTGLSEGSYIQIESGVSLGQTVIVQSDQS
jgi:hypothetical protein